MHAIIHGISIAPCLLGLAFSCEYSGCIAIKYSDFKVIFRAQITLLSIILNLKNTLYLNPVKLPMFIVYLCVKHYTDVFVVKQTI